MKSVMMGLLLALLPFMHELRADDSTLFGAHMQRPEIVVSPESNGLLDVTCKVGFIGGCCFPLTSHDVTATLDVPRGIAVMTGPEPTQYSAVEAPVSGKPEAWATFRWVVKRTSPDAGDSVTVTISSTDSEQVRATCALGQQSRISIKGPHLPDTLPAGQELALAVDAASLDQDHFLKSVRFWYSTEIPAEAEAVESSPELSGRGILRFSLGGRQLMVQGQAVGLARKYEPTVWHGVLPAQKCGPLYGVAVAVDDAGRTAHGPIVRVAAPATGTVMVGVRWWVLIGSGLAVIIAAVGLVRRRGGFAVAGVVLLLAVALEALWFTRSPIARKAQAPGYPTDSSTVVYLFLDRGEPSRLLAEQMETYRRAAPHRIHVLNFVDGITPAPIMETYRARYHVTRAPTAVFDGYFSVDGTNAVAITGTLDRCFGKPTPGLSMELHGGVMAGHTLSLGFIMCNHASTHDAHGSLTTFGFENGVALDGWRCDHVVRQLMVEGRQFAIPVGKCQPPAMMKWEMPDGVVPGQAGALAVILDEKGRLIDSICTEHPCSRTGICG